MSSIRPLDKDDLTQVASLYERVMRSGSRTRPPGLSAYFGRMLLDHPWADPELPSLVSTSREGAVEGFIGSHVRRLRFDGKPVPLRYSKWFVTDPAVRGRGVGALLLRSYLPVARRRCHLRPSSTRVLVHARDPEVAAALALGQALLTRMEGTWWMGHLVEPFTSGTALSSR